MVRELHGIVVKEGYIMCKLVYPPNGANSNFAPLLSVGVELGEDKFWR